MTFVFLFKVPWKAPAIGGGVFLFASFAVASVVLFLRRKGKKQTGVGQESCKEDVTRGGKLTNGKHVSTERSPVSLESQFFPVCDLNKENGPGIEIENSNEQYSGWLEYPSFVQPKYGKTVFC